MFSSGSPPSPEAPVVTAAASNSPIARLLGKLLGFLRQALRSGRLGAFVRWKTLAIMVSLIGIALKFVVIPTAASNAVALIAEGYGIDLQVEDWRTSLLDLSATAEEVGVRVPGPFAKAELLSIDELELDLSLWRRLRGKGWVNEVTVRGPRLYLERQLNGSWNWHELGNFDRRGGASGSGKAGQGGEFTTANLASPGDGAGSVFDLIQVHIEDMKLEWAENLPGESGGGLIHEQKATLFLDDVELTAQDVVGLLDLRPQPTRINLVARTADGKISMAGQANFFSWAEGAPGTGGVVEASAGIGWSPAFELKVYLENVGAGTFSRLTPEVAIRPARGTISGTVDLALVNYELTCRAKVDVRDVTFAVNRASPLLKRRGDQIEREVAKLRPVDGYYEFDCGGLGAEAGFRPIHAFQSQITRQALSSTSIMLRTVVAVDHTRYTTTALEREYRSTASSLIIGVDPNLLLALDVAHSVHREHVRFLDRVGLPRLFGRRP